MAEDGTSVGKITLDLEVKADLEKQINNLANMVSRNLKASMEAGMKGLDGTLKKTMDKATKGMFSGMKQNLSKNLDGFNGLLKSRMKQVADNLKNGIKTSLAAFKNIKLPKMPKMSFPKASDSAAPKQSSTPSVKTIRGPPAMDSKILNAQIETLAATLDNVNARIESQKAKLEQLRASYANTFDGPLKNTLNEQILKTESSMLKLIAQSDKLGFKLADLDAKAAQGSGGIHQTQNEIEKVDRKTKSANPRLNIFSKMLQKVGKSAKTSGVNVNKFGKGISGSLGQMFKWMIVLPSIAKAITALGKGLWEALQANDAFAASLNQIKTNLMVAFMPIYQVILPAVNALMNTLAKATAYLASFISALFGKTYDSSYQAAQSLIDAKAAMGAYGNAAEKAAKQQQELFVASFDELNKPNKATEDTGDGFQMSGPMDQTNAALTSMADKFKNILSQLFKPFQEAWAAEGQNTINAIKYALNSIWELIKAIGRSFLEVWTNGTGTKFLILILQILQNIFNIIGSIAEAFRIAWETNHLGTQLIQTIFDMLINILTIIKLIGDAFLQVWNNGTGVWICTTILQILTNIFGVIGDIALSFANAWQAGDIGVQIIQGIMNIIGNLLTLIRNISGAFREVWAEVGESVATTFFNIVNAVIGLLETLSAKLVEIWNNGGEHFFKGLVRLGAKVFEVAGVIINDFIAPLATGFLNTLAPAFSAILDVAGTVLDKLTELFDWLLNEGRPVLDIITVVVLTFMAAWEISKILAFIQMSGGVIGALTSIGTALFSTTAAKIADKVETIALTLLYAGEFIQSVISGAVQLGVQLGQWLALTAAKIADIVQTGLQVAATLAWNAVCAIATAVTTAFGAAMAFLTSPIGLVILAIGAVIAVGVLLAQNWDWVCQKASELGSWVSQKWEDLKTNVGNACESLRNTVAEKWNNIKQSAHDTMAQMFPEQVAAWDRLKEQCGGSANAFKVVAKTAFDMIHNKLSDVANFVQTFFQNAWNNTFGAIGNFVKNTFDSIVNSIRGAVNSAINIANSAIDKVNSLKVSVPKWVPGIGGKTFGPNIGNIPQLANGAYVGPDQPMLAMIGDNKTQGEFVAPEKKLLETVMTAMRLSQAAQSSAGSGNTENSQPIQIIVKIGEEALINRIIRGINDEKRRTGDPLIIQV